MAIRYKKCCIWLDACTLLQQYQSMYKRQQKASYALPFSSTNNISTFNQLHNTNHHQNHFLSPNHYSQYQLYSQTSSLKESTSNLEYSTARPIYDSPQPQQLHLTERREKWGSNEHQKNVYNMEKSKGKKSPNKKLMIYSYSNITLSHKKINSVLLKFKKRIFELMRRVKREEKNIQGYHPQKNNSFYSGETNNSSHEEAFFRAGFKKEERASNRQAVIQAAGILEAWLEYRDLLSMRKCFFALYQHCNQRKRFSLQLSDSLRVESSPNYFTDFHQDNEISISNALPQQIQESLVYTLEHNSQSTRKEFTQSTMEKIPTAKQYPSAFYIRAKEMVSESQSQIDSKNSPMNQLKSLQESPFNDKSEIKRTHPIQFVGLSYKNAKIRVEGFKDSPLQYKFQLQSSQSIEKAAEAERDSIKKCLSTNDHLDFNQIPIPLPLDIANSKFSDVSNYRVDNTVRKQEQIYHLTVNYANKPVQQQTVLRKYVSQDQKAAGKIENYYLSPKANVVNAPISRFIQEKPVSQLENDRIRIFEKVSSTEATRVQQQPISGNTFQTEMRGNAVLSPSRTPINIQTQKHLSPNHPNQRSTKIIIPSGNAIVMRPEPVRYQRLQRSPAAQRQIIFPNRNQQISSRSPTQRNNIANNHIIINKPSNPPQKILARGNMVSPPRVSPSHTVLRPATEKLISSVKMQDYGFTQPAPLVKQIPSIKQAVSPAHVINVQNQYQLPLTERRFASPPPILKTQQKRPLPIRQFVASSTNWGSRTLRPQSSVSSPKLFFHYNPQQPHQQVTPHSNLTKNSSSISRPKSMNCKLHVTLRKGPPQ